MPAVMVLTDEEVEPWLHVGTVHHLATRTVQCPCGAVEACVACAGCLADERNPCGGGPLRFGHVTCDPYCYLCGSPYDYPPGCEDEDEEECQECGEMQCDCICYGGC